MSKNLDYNEMRYRPELLKGPREAIPPGTELVALTTAFYNGRRLRPGDRFICEGTQRPRWASLPGQEMKNPAMVVQKLGDTKPAAARKAAAAKSTAAAGQVD